MRDTATAAADSSFTEVEVHSDSADLTVQAADGLCVAPDASVIAEGTPSPPGTLSW